MKTHDWGPVAGSLKPFCWLLMLLVLVAQVSSLFLTIISVSSVKKLMRGVK
jgi:hypothetical protein